MRIKIKKPEIIYYGHTRIVKKFVIWKTLRIGWKGNKELRILEFANILQEYQQKELFTDNSRGHWVDIHWSDV